MAEEILTTGGGPASNSAVVLARQGVRAAVVGRVGNDDAGRQAIAFLEAEGVDVTGVEIDPTIQTQTSVIVVDATAGTRSIITTGTGPVPSLNDRAKELVSHSEWVHADHLGYRTVVDVCSRMDSSPLISLDSGNAPIADLDLGRVDLYVPTVETLMTEAGVESADEAAALALQEGCLAVVATEGSKGSRVWWSDAGAHLGRASGAGQASTAAFQDATITSTLGAGDVFHGALLSALVRGHDWYQCLVRANATAAISCGGIDGRQAVPTETELAAALAGNSTEGLISRI